MKTVGFTVLLLIPFFAFAQGIAVNSSGNAPHGSALLDLSSSSKGLLIPRISLSGTNDNITIASPATGLMVYNTSAVSGVGFYYNSGSAASPVWTKFGTSLTAWMLGGNAASSGDFIGTTNAQPLRFKVNNVLAGYISPTSNNTAFGTNALSSVTTAHSNVAIGYNGLLSNISGLRNVAVGHASLASNTSGFDNVAVGADALQSNYQGHRNIAMGTYAMENNINGSDNVALGYSAMYYADGGSGNVAAGRGAGSTNSSGNTNIMIGLRSMYESVSASNNIAIGDSTLYNQEVNAQGRYENVAIGSNAMFTNTNGYWNTAVGSKALASNTTGHMNATLGKDALLSNTTGYENIAVGYSALKTNTTGRYNVAVGSKAMSESTTGIENIAIGMQSMYNNETGSKNSAFGFGAMSSNLDGDLNTGIGWNSMFGNQHCNNVTALGANANFSNAVDFNSTAIGYDAEATASNQIVLGNVSISSIGGFAPWSNLSDARFKKDVVADVPGLEFIRKLRPVTYHYDLLAYDEFRSKDPLFLARLSSLPESTRASMQRAQTEKESIVYTGFLAQEVEAAAKDLNYSFSGVQKPKHEGDYYSIAYGEFIAPLVKAVQELAERNEALEMTVSRQQSVIEELKAEVQNLMK